MYISSNILCSQRKVYTAVVIGWIGTLLYGHSIVYLWFQIITIPLLGDGKLAKIFLNRGYKDQCSHKYYRQFFCSIACEKETQQDGAIFDFTRKVIIDLKFLSIIWQQKKIVSNIAICILISSSQWSYYVLT